MLLTNRDKSGLINSMHPYLRVSLVGKSRTYSRGKVHWIALLNHFLGWGGILKCTLWNSVWLKIQVKTLCPAATYFFSPLFTSSTEFAHERDCTTVTRKAEVGEPDTGRHPYDVLHHKWLQHTHWGVGRLQRETTVKQQAKYKTASLVLPAAARQQQQLAAQFAGFPAA